MVQNSITSLIILVRERNEKKYPSIIQVEQSSAKIRSQAFAANINETGKKFYGDPVWIEDKEFKTISDFEHQLANMRCKNDRLYAEHQNLQVKKRDYNKLENDYVHVHKRFNQHEDATEQTINALLDEKAFDKRKMTNQKNRIMD